MLKQLLSLVIQFVTLPLRILPFLYVKLRSMGSTPWVHIKIAGKYDDTPPSVGISTWFKPPPKKFYQLVLELNLLARQAGRLKLREVSVTIHNPRLGWARAFELRQALQGLTDQGVRVHAFLVSGDALSYYIALGASEILAPPALTLDLLGFRVENLYFKELFDKQKIRPNFIHVGDFKSAAERFTRKQGSSHAKKQLKEIIDNLQDHITGQLKQRRHEKLKPAVSKDPLLACQKQAPLTAQRAAELGLIDGVCYQAQLQAHIAHDLGRGMPGKLPGLDQAIQKLYRKLKKLFQLRPMKRVALVLAEGPIIDSKEPTSVAISYNDYRRALAEVKQGNFDAVVLRINSPGGSALVSDLLWNDLMSLKQHGAEPFFEDSNFVKYPALQAKPGEEKAGPEEPRASAKDEKAKSGKKIKKRKQPAIFVSQSDIAASGGYYLSAVTQKVFASPLTITGSIGVVGGKFNLAGFAKKLGITHDTVETGKNGSLYSTFSDFTAEQKKNMAGSMQKMYDLFRHRIATGRQMKDPVIKKLGGGRVYSGSAALANGLVDEEGGMVTVFQAVKSHLKQKETDSLALEVFPRIKAPLFSKASLLPGMWQKLETLAALNREQVFFLDDDLF